MHARGLTFPRFGTLNLGGAFIEASTPRASDSHRHRWTCTSSAGVLSVEVGQLWLESTLTHLNPPFTFSFPLSLSCPPRLPRLSILPPPALFWTFWRGGVDGIFEVSRVARERRSRAGGLGAGGALKINTDHATLACRSQVPQAYRRRAGLGVKRRRGAARRGTNRGNGGW